MKKTVSAFAAIFKIFAEHAGPVLLPQGGSIQ
jgi:hypothetical protein